MSTLNTYFYREKNTYKIINEHFMYTVLSDEEVTLLGAYNGKHFQNNVYITPIQTQ
jgi:hypothetical protein